jgi:hypothetical protein
MFWQVLITTLSIVMIVGASAAPRVGAQQASTVTVTSAADSGPGSLRAALADAAAGTTIVFSPTLAGATIQLASTLRIERPLSIDGAAAPGLTLSGGDTTRVFAVGFRSSATIANLIIANGYSNGAGGGIAVADEAQLTLRDCVLRDNRAAIGGGIRGGFKSRVEISDSRFERNDGSAADNGFSAGAVALAAGGQLLVQRSTFIDNLGVNGGALYTLLGPLTVEDSLFRGNVGLGGGGAIFTDGANLAGPDPGPDTIGGDIIIRRSHFERNEANNQGGALYLYAYERDRVLIEESTIISNTARLNGNDAIGGGLRATSNASLTIRSSTFAGNQAAQGGAVWLGESLAPTLIENSTFSANRATGAGNISQGGAFAFINHSQLVTITHSTIVDNRADFGSPAFFWTAAPQITLVNSLVVRNQAVTFPNGQTRGTLRDGGGNLEFPAAANGAPPVVTGSTIADPLLAPLGYLDGALLHRLGAGSPAIGLAQLLLPRDQRGALRDADPDSGAYEANGVLPTLTETLYLPLMRRR